MLSLSWLIIILSGCVESYNYDEGMVWNTSYHITYRGSSTLKDSISTVLSEVGHSLSVFDEGSLVSRVNSGIRVEIDSMFAEVYRCSERLNRETGGRFDPTLSPVITAWGFGKGHKVTGDTMRIDSIMRFVGIGRTRLEGGVLKKDDVRTQFNFSAIAKGYGCDKIAEMLERNGVTDYLIEIGGELRLKGFSPSGGKWRVSVDKPIVSSDREIHSSQVILTMDKGGLATSGNYRNFHLVNGERLGHTIDIHTGKPATTDIASASVICGNCMEADGYSTSLMSMKSDEAKRFCLRYHLACMLVMHSGEVWVSPEFKSYISE